MPANPTRSRLGKRFTLTCAAALSTLSHHPNVARAEVVMLAPGDDVEGAINAAQPGDELVLAGGTYPLTERFGISVRGTSAAPIVVRAADDAVPIFSRASADQNVIDVDDAEHLELRGLTITGGSHGLRLTRARFVTIYGCEIHDTGDVALSANSGGPYEALHILYNHIHHTNNTGEGMYLGCNDNACQVFDSVIRNNYVHHTNGPTVEQGDGIELKEGSYNNVISDNVIHDTNYPCILTYATAGNGAPNVIERNALWGCGDHGIQSAADAIIRNNIILGAAGSGIAMQPHQAGAPDNLLVVHNTVLNPSGDAIRLSGIAGDVTVANNALYSESGYAVRADGALDGLVVLGNVGLGGAEPSSIGVIAAGTLAGDFVAASFTGSVPNQVYPKASSALLGAASAEHLAGDDFNGLPRDGATDVGAYAYDALGNPGWELSTNFKAPTDPPVVVDAGAGSGGAMSSAGAGGAGGDASTAGVGAEMGSPRDAGARDAGEPATSDAHSASDCGCRAVRAQGSARGSLIAALTMVLLAVRGARRRVS